jgi:outer membrane lipoprotein-sorting protein
MKKLIMLLMIVSGLNATYAQDNPQANKLLNELNNKLTSYKNIKAEFKYALVNQKAGVKSETKGKVFIKGNKFHANYMGIDDIYDGNKRYQIVHENEEVNISNHQDDDEFTPDKIFTFYKNGYIKKMDIKQKLRGRTIQYIKLIPKDTNAPEKYILLGIDTQSKNIYNVIIKEKDGSTITFEFTKFSTNQILPENLFKFNKSKYKDYYINELN